MASQKFVPLKINLAIGFIQKKPAGMHWLGYNETVSISWLNEAKTQPTANFENFEINSNMENFIMIFLYQWLD